MVITTRAIIRPVLGILLFTYSLVVLATVGTTPGEFKVNQNGAATYTVPIQVPPGINGMQPNLALVYNSQKGNGLLGVGWSLGGLSTIQRCGGNIDQDGSRSGIDFGAERFCLNGQRLMAAGVREYRTELNNYNIIKSEGGDPENPETFKVWTKDGHLMLFGKDPDNNLPDARLNPQSGDTLVWAINEITDRNGNYIKFEYGIDNSSGEYYPTLIKYGAVADPDLGTAVIRKVTFDYGTTSRSDVSVKYVAGAKLTTSKLLATIETYYGATEVKSYTLTPETETNTGKLRSRIYEIKECEYKDNTCLNPTVIDWQEAGSTAFGSGVDAGVSLRSAGDELATWNRFIDVDNDGVIDLLKVTNTNVTVQLRNPDGTVKGTKTSNGVITAPSSSALGIQQYNEIADVNGDGYVDIFRLKPPPYQVNNFYPGTVLINYGNGDGSFDETPQEIINLASIGEDGDPVDFSTKGFRFWNQLIDMNGDGILDVFRVDKNYPTIDSNANCGNTTCTGVEYKYFEIILGEIDSAGKYTVAQWPGGYPAASYISHDHGVNLADYMDYDEDPPALGFRRNNQLADLNGDGKIDIFRVVNTSNGDVRPLMSNGTDGLMSFTQASTSSNAIDSQFIYAARYTRYFNFDNQLVDVNGDGVIDIATAERSDELQLYGNGTYYDSGQCSNGCSPTYEDNVTYTGNLIVRLGNGDGTFQVDDPDKKFSQGVLRQQGFLQYQSGYGFPILHCDYPDPCYYTLPQSIDPDSTYKGISHWHQFADMDSDGYVDLVRVENGGSVKLFRGNGDGTFDTNGLAVSGPALEYVDNDGFSSWNRLLDMNSDGIIDFVKVDNSSWNETVFEATHVKPSLATKFTNGYGLETSIDSYSTLTGSSVYTNTATIAPTDSNGIVLNDNYPLRHVQMPMLVVGSHSVSNGTQFSYSYSYQYKGAMIDLKHGWAGFESATKKDLSTGINTITEFNQAFPYTGLPATIKTQINGAGSNKYLSTKDIHWSDNYDSANQTYFIFKEWDEDRSYEPNDNYSLVSYARNDYGYDAVGNIDSITATTDIDEDVNTTQNKKTRTTSFTNTYATGDYPGQLTSQDETITDTVKSLDGNTTYADQRNVERTYYTSTGQLEKETTRLLADPLRLEKSYEYYLNGLPKKQTVKGWDGDYQNDGTPGTGSDVLRVTDFDYSDIDDNTNDKWSVTSTQDGHDQTVTYYGAYGNKAQSDDVNGISSFWEYDGYGRLKGAYQYTKTAGQKTSTSISSTCPAGMVCSGAAYMLTVDPPAKASVTKQYDALGREIRTASQDYDGSGFIYVDTTYDAPGRVNTVSVPYASGTPAVTDYDYDSASRLRKITNPDNSANNASYVEYTLNGLVKTVTQHSEGEADKQTEYTYDTRNQIERITDAKSGVTKYEYGSFGVLLEITDAASQKTTISYDSYGMKQSQQDPDIVGTGSWKYRYNAFGELKWQKDPKSQITSFGYDVLGRMTERSEQSSPAVTTQWTYDTAIVVDADDNTVNNATAYGLLSSVVRDGVTKTYTYDDYRRLRKETTSISGNTYSVKTYYNSNDQIEHVEYPQGGPKLDYVYYTSGALHQINEGSTTYWSANTYNEYGQVKTESWGNGVNSTRTYDAVSRLTGIDTSKDTTTIQSLTYDYYGAGNLKSRSNGTETEKFYYDALDRLIRAKSSISGQSAKEFSYDAVGNITYKSGVGEYSYGGSNGGEHAVTAVNFNATSYNTSDAVATANYLLTQDSLTGANAAAAGASDCNNSLNYSVLDVLCINNRIQDTSRGGLTRTYEYDANGNLEYVKEAGTTIRSIDYTHFNKPASITEGADVTSYTYGPGYNRLTRTDKNGVTTTYIGKLYENIDSDQHRYYVSAAGRLVMQVNRTTDQGGNELSKTIAYVHTDLLGSIDALTDSGTGQIITNESFSYDEFGQPRAADWSEGNAVQSALTTRGYTGHEMENGLGLVNMNARLFDPQLGRFMTADPIIANPYNPQSLNRYSYVLNNPFRYTDPTGNDAIPNPDGSVYVEEWGLTVSLGGGVVTDNILGDSYNSLIDALNATMPGYTAMGNNCVGENCSFSANLTLYLDPAIQNLQMDACAYSLSCTRVSNNVRLTERMIRERYGDDIYNLTTDVRGEGFQSSIFYNPVSDHATVAFAGTNHWDDLDDWASGYSKISNAQVDQAILLSQLLSRQETSISFTGHSLGGALASAGAYSTDNEAITFNAEGIHPLTLGEMSLDQQREAKITAYYIKGEVVSSFQDAMNYGYRHLFGAQKNWWNVNPWVPDAIGTRIGIQGLGWGSSIEQHKISSICRALSTEC